MPALNSHVAVERADFSLSAGFGGREIAIRQALLQDCLRHLLVSARRSDWRYCSSHSRSSQRRPSKMESSEDCGIALHVGIVDAQDHGAAVMARV